MVIFRKPTYRDLQTKRVENRDVEFLNVGRLVALVSLSALLSVRPVYGQVEKTAPETGILGLPAGAVVVETRLLPSSAHAHRQLALWMENPEEHPGDGLYTCPERTRGSYYSGPTRVSLVNTASGQIINTVRVTVRSVATRPGGKTDDHEEDTFDIPYQIRRDLYRVNLTSVNGEGKPTIIDLKDYNFDGRALEFALFNAQSCEDVAVQLIGYSLPRDRVIQYAFRSSNDPAGAKPWFWADNLFAHKTVAKGHWHYTMPFPGAPCVFDYRYRPLTEDFSAETTCH